MFSFYPEMVLLVLTRGADVHFFEINTFSKNIYISNIEIYVKCYNILINLCIFIQYVWLLQVCTTRWQYSYIIFCMC